MADNTRLNQNTTTGDLIATEDIGGVKVQRNKIVLGAAGVDNGNVSASNPFPAVLVDTSNNEYQAAQDDTVLLLRRLVKICETLATQDSSQRQKITLDAMTSGLTLTTVTGVTTVTTVSTVTSVTNIAGLGGYDPKFLMADTARIAYAQGIRANLMFS